MELLRQQKLDILQITINYLHCEYLQVPTLWIPSITHCTLWIPSVTYSTLWLPSITHTVNTFNYLHCEYLQLHVCYFTILLFYPRLPHVSTWLAKNNKRLLCQLQRFYIKKLQLTLNDIVICFALKNYKMNVLPYALKKKTIPPKNLSHYL